jgi:hypothetical protein
MVELLCLTMLDSMYSGRLMRPISNVPNPCFFLLQLAPMNFETTTLNVSYIYQYFENFICNVLQFYMPNNLFYSNV